MNGKWTVPLFVVAILLLVLSLAMIVYEPVPYTVDETPRSITDAFYSDYIRYKLLGYTLPENLAADESLTRHTYFPCIYLSDACRRRIDSFTASQRADYDPFLREQDIPSGFEVGNLLTSGDEATVVVHTWHGGPGVITDDRWLTVDLLQIDGQWKIDRISG